MQQRLWLLLLLTLSVNVLVGCQQVLPPCSSTTGPDSSITAQTMSDREFTDRIRDAQSMKIYCLCEDGSQSIVYTVSGKEYTVSSLKLVREITEEELSAIKMFFDGWAPSANVRESEDLLTDIYLCFDNNLVISCVQNHDYARIGQESYMIPNALYEFINGLDV